MTRLVLAAGWGASGVLSACPPADLDTIPAPDEWWLADVVTAAADTFRLAVDQLERLDTEWRSVWDDYTGVKPLSAAYRAWLPEYRAMVGELISRTPCEEDRWVAIGDAIASPGRLDTGLSALLNDGRITGHLIRTFGLTPDDLMYLGQIDYAYACKHGADLPDMSWRRPVEAFEDSAYMRELASAIGDAERELIECAGWWRPATVPNVGTVPTVVPWNPLEDAA